MTAKKNGPSQCDSTSTRFDANEVIAFYNGAKPLVRELIEMFLEECPKLLAKVETAVQNGEADGIRRTAHTLKGSAGVLLATDIQSHAAELERMGKSGDLDGLDLEWERLRVATTDSLRSMEAYLKGTTPT